MAGNERLDLDALALLVVPLDSPRAESDYLRWHRWDEAYGQACGLDSNEGFAHEVSPFKRYPVNEWHYFNAHVERLLFPRGEDQGERWICCPEDLYLCASREREEPKHRARIDLLECLTIPRRADCAFGLLHLSLEPDELGQEDHPLWWAAAIRSPFRRSTVARPHLELRHGGAGTELKGRRPLRDLVERTLGTPHHDLERRLYTAVMAPCPAGCEDAEDQAHWRRTLARRGWTIRPEDRELFDGDRERQQTARFGRVTALVRGEGAVLTQTDPLTVNDARNFRSYWSESLLTGLLQQDSLEHFQDRLAKIGSPVKPDIERLYRAWLDFRNLIWWSQLSTSSAVPQELLFRFRAARGTERLFTDLEGDLATYSAQRRSIVEGKQAVALVNLQAAGAAIAVLGPLLGIAAVIGARGGILAIWLVVSLLVAIGAGVLVHWQLQPREELPDTA